MTKMSTTHAKVHVTVVVPAGSWGPECSIQQVYDQAKQEALAKVRRVCEKEGWQIQQGDPRVVSVLSEEVKL